MPEVMTDQDAEPRCADCVNWRWQHNYDWMARFAGWHCTLDSEDEGCPECGDGDNPDLWQSACIDDMCHGGEVPCMHGDYATLPCGLCGKRP